MGFAAAIPMLVSTVSTIGGAIFRSSQQSAAADAQAQAYQYNAAVAQQNAAAARAAAAANADTQRRINSARMGHLTTGIYNQGVTLEGTPLLLLADQAAQSELEVQKIKQKGEIDATNYGNQANQQSYAASQAQEAGSRAAGSTLLTGITQAGGTALGQYSRSDFNYR